jgi:DeoR/GlpR family transcriptional regulator of sugar metabolism
MNRQLDIPTRHRAIKILKALIEYPHHYTIQDLANQNDVSKDTIRDDIEGKKMQALRPNMTKTTAML